MTEDARREFEAAYDELIEPLFRYFLYRLSDRDRARDLAQETFMRTWDYCRKGGTIHALKPFLYTTAGNLYKNELRARKPVVSLDGLLEAGAEFVSDATSEEEKAEARLVLERLDGLKSSDRELLTLRYVDGLSTKEIADTLGKNENAVSVALHRAIGRLRELYEPTP